MDKLTKLVPPSDKEVAEMRDADTRFAVMIGCTLTLLIAPILLGNLWAYMLGGNPILVHAFRLIGICVGGLAAGKLVPSNLLVHNNEQSAYITQDLIADEPRAYGPGVHASFPRPFEVRNKQGNYSLRTATLSFEVTVVTEREVLRIKGTFGFARSLKHLTTSIGIKPAAAQASARAMIEGFLTAWPRIRDGKQTVRDLQEDQTGVSNDLYENFVSGPSSRRFEEASGYRITSIVISEIRLTKEVEEALASVSETDKIQMSVANHFGMSLAELRAARKAGKIPWDEYKAVLDRASATSGNATQVIHTFEGKPPAGVLTNLDQGGKRGKRN